MRSYGGQDEKNTAGREGGGFEKLASMETGGIPLYEHS